MDNIKVGIIGTGFSAASHIEALRRIPFVEVAAVCGSNADKGRVFAESMGVPVSYGSAAELIADPDIQAVHNCTPNALHYELNKMVLLAGKHLMSEKPLALNSEQSAELAEIAGKVGVVSGVSFNYRHFPMVCQTKELLESGGGRNVSLVYGGYLQDWLSLKTDYSWRLDEEKNGISRAIADIGSHWCDTIQYVLGKKITKVFADLKTVHPIRKKPRTTMNTFGSSDHADREDVKVGTEDYGSVLIHLEDGVQGVFTVSQVSSGRKNRLFYEIVADGATYAWDQEKPNDLWVGRRDRANEQLVRDPGLLDPKAAALAHYPGGHQEGWPDGLKNLCIDFYTAVQNKQHEPTFASMDDGHRIMRLIEAIMESHRTEKWVHI
ncbi:dehydrogenase [Cohnella kolymensis]|uniref:Dehydrogenase n=1 Tax=Cohnella kolymensis TaxID=1590652 RepID=A0ABR5A0X5_9BACL|nr:Gfo/Idh/MocA family oxidoreductase [Cohnella kolymensis]KIL34680.1 dehydrogenase [Cohnella kolymensis]